MTANDIEEPHREAAYFLLLHFWVFWRLFFQQLIKGHETSCSAVENVILIRF